MLLQCFTLPEHVNDHVTEAASGWFKAQAAGLTCYIFHDLIGSYHRIKKLYASPTRD